MNTTLPPAGWYPNPDPKRPFSTAYWNGTAWTGETADPIHPETTAQRYQFRTARNTREVQRLLRKGWEVVTSSGSQSWFWGSNLRVVMRKPL